MNKRRSLSTSLAVLALVVLITPGGLVFAAGPGAGEGLVIFTRDNSIKGKAIRFNMTVDGRQNFQLRAGTTIEVPLSAGTHSFTVSAPTLDGQDSITLDVREGWTYMVEGHILWGWPTGRPKFRIVSESGPAPGVATAADSGGHGGSTTSAPLAGAALGSAAAVPGTGSQPSRSAEESGRIALRNFAGDWAFSMWSLTADGTRLEGRGFAEGVAESNAAVRLYISDFESPYFPMAGDGQVRISYAEGKAFTLESSFTKSSEILTLTGMYEAATGRYVFFVFDVDGETATGMPRSSLRVEIRSVDLATWIADTYTTIDNQSVQVQSYTFTRR